MKIKQNFFAIKRWNISYYRLIHGFKTAIACLIGLVIEKHYKWPMGQWVPITIMVVMSAQTHFGGALRKAMMRLLGTVSGVVLAIIILWLFGHTAKVVFATIFFASAIFAYIASSRGDINYAGTLGGVTLILVLTGQNVTIEIALQRGFYITVGIIIALLVSRFIFPIHARDHLKYRIANTLRNLSKLYDSSAFALQDSAPPYFSHELNSKISTHISEQPRMIYEAVVGSLDIAAKKAIFNEIVDSEQNMDRLINLIYTDLHNAADQQKIRDEMLKINDLHQTISNNLNYLANCLENRELPAEFGSLNGVLVKIDALISDYQNLSGEQLTIKNSVLFLTQQLLREVERMRKLIGKVNGKNGNSVL